MRGLRRKPRGAHVLELLPGQGQADVVNEQLIDEQLVPEGHSDQLMAKWLTSEITALDAAQLREAMYYLIGHSPDAVGAALADLRERGGRRRGRGRHSQA